MLFLARHGETDWNCSGRMQGRQGSALTERGMAQARALAQFATEHDIENILCSPLQRARHTADIVASAVGCRVLPLDSLMEVDFGDCTGLTEAEIRLRYPDLRERRNASKWTHRWPNGESYADAAERLRATKEIGIALQATGNTLVVAHQSLNRALLAEFTGMPRDAAISLTHSADDVLRLDCNGNVMRTAIVGDSGWAAAIAYGAPRIHPYR